MALFDLPLWRSVLVFPGDPPAEVLVNLAALRADVRPEGIDAHLLAFVGVLADRSVAAAPIGLVQQHYDMLAQQGDANGLSGTIRLEEVVNAGLPFQPPPDYRYQLDQYRERVLGDGFGLLLQQAATALTTGYTYSPLPRRPPVTVRGAEQAMTFVEQGLAQLRAQFTSEDVEGTLRDVASVYTRYQQRIGKPPTGVLTGIRLFDSKHGGIQPGDLCLVLGYTGHMKSTTVINIAYRAAIVQGKNVALLSTETSAKALQDMIVVMHALHPKWSGRCITVTYTKLRQADLTAAEDRHVQEVIADLAADPCYGQIVYKEPTRNLTVRDVRQWAEQQDRQTPLDLLVVDYAAQVDPSVGGSALKESANANIAVREFKQLAMSFRRGHGLGVLSPWQSNREGYKEAEKAGGLYNLRALAWAPEAERSADLIYTVYLNEQLANGKQLQVGNIKARDRELVTASTLVFADGGTKVVEDVDQSLAHQQVVVGGF